MTGIYENQVRSYPETSAGGFTRADGTIEFYNRVRSLLSEASVVLDFGAGRAQWVYDSVERRRNMRFLRGSVAEVIGADIDPVVRHNPAVDRSVVLVSHGQLPISDSSVDVIIADYVFEHLTHPESVAAEFYRVLRPNGWVCARTPNKWGTIGFPTRIVPNRFHQAILSRLQPKKAAEDTFPTTYKLNTTRQLRKTFPADRFRNASYLYDSEPAYAADSKLAWRIFRLLNAIMPPRLKTIHMVFLQKRPIDRVGEHS